MLKITLIIIFPILATTKETEVKETKEEKEEVLTINIKPFLMPVSVILASIIIAVGFVIGMNNLGNTLKGSVNGIGTTTGTTGTTTPTTTGTTSSVTQDQIKSLTTNAAAITIGDPNSKLLLVEFSDTSCPYCHVAGGQDAPLNKSMGSQFTLVADGGTYVAPIPEFKKLVDAGKAAFIYVYTTGHGQGSLGNQALFCANEKGKFWPAHDLIMSDAGYTLLNDTTKGIYNWTAAGAQNGLKTNADDMVASFLSSVVDQSFMKDCLSSGKYAPQITAGDSLAATFGVSGTPGFFVNTTSFAGAYSYTDMKSAVEAVIGST